ncbi:30S ribosomal protein S6 [Plectonema cf. radiosum LEGE 06105]|uniref:Small ribosomal subunit protein bS6 n=1 Tax=Plectonema cf. radiosum LEGE 06105 TaxID=945769 RepID=A0A8J7EZ73_9CYAN|nr:30S ribosomal protein S6 [Plectonema radiosum]MBE9211158.1 30S ribosomal protein S6 [Plectonema cf. radiosum LEGE 06105]
MATYYETMYILRPDLIDEQVEQNISKYENLLKENGAENLQIQNRGKRRLAYEINKHRDGVYVQMNYTANGDAIAPMERAMRLSEEVIRYLTIKQKQQTVEQETPTEEVSIAAIAQER